MYAKILVPVDGSETSIRGLDEAIRIAANQGSQLRLVHVVNELIIDGLYSQGQYSGELIDALREGGKKILEQGKAQARQCGIACEGVLLESLGGAAAAYILKQATEWPADLIVMGTHGRRGVARFALGSDAERVLRSTTVPVMLVRNVPQDTVQSEVKPADVRAA